MENIQHGLVNENERVLADVLIVPIHCKLIGRSGLKLQQVGYYKGSFLMPDQQ